MLPRSFSDAGSADQPSGLLSSFARALAPSWGISLLLTAARAAD